MLKHIALNNDLIELIEAIREAENENSEFEKSFSRVVNYLIVLGIDKYSEIFNIPEFKEFPIMKAFDFEKRMGKNPYKLSEMSDIARKRERLKRRLAELGRSFFEESEE
jgi:hypothetical protein